MEKIKIRTLILDYGGVISQPQNTENVNNILSILEQDHLEQDHLEQDHLKQDHLKQDHDDFMSVYQSHRAGYDNGQCSGQEYWTNILEHYGLEPDSFEIDHLIQEDVSSWIQLNESMIQFITANRGRIHQLAVISNMTTDCLAYIRSHHEWFALFDELVFSCDVGVNKPDKEIYKICLRKLNTNPNECLFVDDSTTNVNGAIAVGMHGLQFNTFTRFVLDLDEVFSLTH